MCLLVSQPSSFISVDHAPTMHVYFCSDQESDAAISRDAPKPQERLVSSWCLSSEIAHLAIDSCGNFQPCSSYESYIAAHRNALRSSIDRHGNFAR
ncbi:hypothetical protein GUITHDRAFT_114297 [Guillardia theta CCMP2712]|uniref:Uncharacterized protein n=1 Tax=Guillardia theta (strain CCMP2712) TaxID=905079 RepID=L1ITH6_GUITC|nr:hypothetical protein GUITHDRAFT_114297 [Guillardia theta CCMP2712]EKX39571.1 hypothetical protein GUITHDRAFT_114297 [Guillardia theta CCMP2712]|eukprot:XP_005826551.1 hypothetical protein GUITHDRAFT_114297 [Guillardia theta CCMP2712]